MRDREAAGGLAPDDRLGLRVACGIAAATLGLAALVQMPEGARWAAGLFVEAVLAAIVGVNVWAALQGKGEEAQAEGENESGW